jgi:hypothetical protein
VKNGRGPWLVAAVALVLNLIGITWGLPARWHPDEKADAVARMVRDGSAEPESFINPSLPLYATAPFVWIQDRAARAGLLTGTAADPLLVARGLSALAGAVAVFLLALLARRREGPGFAVLASLLLATAPAIVNLCHFATPEAWLLLGTVATFVTMLAYREGRAPAWSLGLALGLTASTKYTAVALVPAVLLAVVLRPRSEPTRAQRLAFLVAGVLALALGLVLLSGQGAALATQLRLEDVRLLHPEHAARFVAGLGKAAAAGGLALVAVAALALRGQRLAVRLARRDVLEVGAAAAAGFLLGTPYAAITPIAFLSDLAFNDQTRFEYKGMTGPSTSYLAYVKLGADALGWPLLAAAALGVVAAVRRVARGDATGLLFLVSALTTYLLVASSGPQAMRLLVPALPAAAYLAALGLASLTSLPARRVATTLVLARAALVCSLLLRLFYVDSRLRAERWLATHVPPGETVDLLANNPGYAPRAPEGRTLRIVRTLSREMAPADVFSEAAARYAHEASPWLVLTASYYERFLEHPEQRPERTAFFRALLQGRGGFRVAARFRQEGWLRPPNEFLDPEIVILEKTGPSGPS